MRFRAASLLLLLFAAALLSACASSAPKDPSKGFRVLEAVVVGRRHDPAGAPGTSYRGRGNFYLVFETQEGDKSASYTFLVNENQYRRYPEGSRVQITLADHQLRGIRPLP